MSTSNPIAFGTIGFVKTDKSADLLEKCSNLCLKPLHAAFGKTYNVTTNHFERVASTHEIAMRIFYILLCPLTIPLTFVGVLLANLSQSYKTTYKTYISFEKHRESIRQVSGALYDYKRKPELEALKTVIKTVYADKESLNIGKTSIGIKDLSDYLRIAEKLLIPGADKIIIDFRNFIMEIIEFQMLHQSVSSDSISLDKKTLYEAAINLAQKNATIERIFTEKHYTALINIFEGMFINSLKDSNLDEIIDFLKKMETHWLKHNVEKEARDQIKKLLGLWLNSANYFRALPKEKKSALCDAFSSIAKVLTKDIEVNESLNAHDVIFITLAARQQDEAARSKFTQLIKNSDLVRFYEDIFDYANEDLLVLLTQEFPPEDIQNYTVEPIVKNHMEYLAQNLSDVALGRTIGKFIYKDAKTVNPTVRKLLDHPNVIDRKTAVLQAIPPEYLSCTTFFNEDEIKILIHHYTDPARRIFKHYDHDKSTIRHIFYAIFYKSLKKQMDNEFFNDDLFNEEKNRFINYLNYLKDLSTNSPVLLQDAMEGLKAACENHQQKQPKFAELYTSLESMFKTNPEKQVA